MEAYPVTEFEAVIDHDGVIQLPKELRKKFASGTHIIVRVTEGDVAGSLRSRGISEEDVEAIARLQMEQREDVIRFLSAEGLLSSNSGFRRRAKVFGK